jgi:hypothetical protein
LNAGRRNLKLHINDSAWMFFEQGNNCAWPEKYLEKYFCLRNSR